MRKIKIIEEQEQKDHIFWEILLQEQYVGERLAVNKEVLRKAGGINKKLSAKADYELLLRLAAKYRLEVVNIEEPEAGDVSIYYPKKVEKLENLKTDCYITGKYKDALLTSGYFNDMVEAIICAAQKNGLETQVLTCLEQMISRAEAYYEIDDAVRPILLYKGSDICHNVLNVFADAFGRALEEQGQLVEYYDMESQPLGEITKLVGKRYKAVVGFQTYAFTIKMKDEKEYLHNLIGGKKYNFVFDHPIWLLPHLKHDVKNFSVLTHDNNYIEFIEQYYDKKAYMFPPAGIVRQMPQNVRQEKRYDLSFVGTYGDYMNEVMLIHTMERKHRFLANRFLLKMRKNPNFTAEKALKQTLQDQGIALQGEAFLQQFYQLRRVIYCVMHYYRHQALKTILDAGIELDVFGDSWRKCPLKRYENLICHPDVTVEESLEIWNQSKMSLNIMSWHKAGFTERIANSMLAEAVVVTDKSGYLVEHFDNGADIILFDLEKLSELPERLKRLLRDDAERERIAERAKRKALCEHTWRSRAEEFLKWME